MPAFELPPSQWHFPEPANWPSDSDVIAIGADLEPSTVLEAYLHGIFPMQVPTGELGWWSPDPRGILPLDGLRITSSLAKSCRRFDVDVDRDFAGVMRACADPRRPDGWITEEFIDTYTRLHELGWAHSVEVRAGGELVGGLYGIECGGLFAGESMFHRRSDASKVALVALVDVLRQAGGPRLLDVQWTTDHLASLGAVDIPRAEYLRRLAIALPLPPAFGGRQPGAGLSPYA